MRSSVLSLYVPVLAIVAALSPAWAADPPDGIALGVASGPGAGGVTLTWTGGATPFRVYRSATAAAITNAGGFLGQAVSTTWFDTPPADNILFYRVVMCTAGADCASAFCADGWCCNTDCSTTCEACNLPASAGVCAPVPGGSDPADECPGGGTCNGAGGCQVAPQPNGSLCVGSGECTSGFCTDGVCCASACGGTCEACAQPGRAGFCDPVAAGMDPANECPVTAASTCATTGVCAGNRACQLHAAGTICAGAQCGGALSRLPDHCNGMGVCVDGGVQSCPPYACNAATGLCRTSCGSSTDCGTGFGCKVGTGSCLALDGGSCSSGSDCLNGTCCANICRNPTNDANNCGSCGLTCTNAHGTTSCLNSICFPVCASGWSSCDGNSPNGCETSLTTLTNCAACGVACNLPNASESCATGACVISACNAGFSNCDSGSGNGCEVSHAQTTGNCPNATNVGTFDGDTACLPFCSSNTSFQLFATQSGSNSVWFRARVSEGSAGPTRIEHRITLDVPAGVDYDLYVYQSCGTPFASSTNGAGSSETVTVFRDDTVSDDSFDYWVEVRYHSGASCNLWTLRFFGHGC